MERDTNSNEELPVPVSPLHRLAAEYPDKTLPELLAIFERQARSKPPTDAAILERAVSMANRAIYTLQLQQRRLKSKEPEDDEFLFRIWADFEFFILTLWHLRNVAKLALHVKAKKEQIQQALKQFDDELPSLSIMRNVLEHLEDYGVDKGKDRSISRRQLQVGSWTTSQLRWLGAVLDVDNAIPVAFQLYRVLREARDSVTKQPLPGNVTPVRSGDGPLSVRRHSSRTTRPPGSDHQG